MTGPFDALFVPPGADEGFLHVSSYDTTGGNADRLEIAPGDSAVLLDLDGPGVIRRLWITVSSRDPDYLRRIALLMYWDGETQPSVAVPLGDFFGNGFDRRHYAALPMGVSSGGFYCYLPMPFARHARLVAVNGTGRAVDAFYYNVDIERPAPLPDTVATLHAWWHRDPRTSRRAPHLVLAAQGRGRFVGMSLNAQSTNGRLWFLEGDEIYHVDGTFRGQGTGTEDYFNSGWYFDQGPFAAPFHGLVVKDDSLGRIAAYRWHLLDPIAFHDSIRVEIEHGHANEEVADYATTAFWYQTEPHAPLPPLPPPDARRVMGVVVPPDAVPGDSLRAARHEGELVYAVPVPREDRYEVTVYPLGAPAGGTQTWHLAGSPPRTVNLQATDAGTVLPPVLLGQTAGRGEVDVFAAGAAGPPAAVAVRPVRRWATAWLVAGPFPNPQRLGTEHSPALDSAYGPERHPSPDSAYRGPDGVRIAWRPATAGADGQVRLNPLFTPNDWVAAYAQAALWAPTAREAVLLLGADDAHQLWVNGVKLSERQGRHIAVPDDLTIPVHLRSGWNTILLKVADLDGGWAFQLRAADPDGDLRWSARPDR